MWQRALNVTNGGGNSSLKKAISCDYTSYTYSFNDFTLQKVDVCNKGIVLQANVLVDIGSNYVTTLSKGDTISFTDAYNNSCTITYNSDNTVTQTRSSSYGTISLFFYGE